MNRESRYLVIKRKDMEAALTDSMRHVLQSLTRRVEDYRRANGKPDLECVVVERDWPEYEPTWLAIERRVDEGAPVMEFDQGSPAIYEDDLPVEMTKGDYREWFKHSNVIDGVRMGPAVVLVRRK